jgi:hypothetical protein
MQSQTMEVAYEDGISMVLETLTYLSNKGWRTSDYNMGLALRRLRMSFIPSRLGSYEPFLCFASLTHLVLREHE